MREPGQDKQVEGANARPEGSAPVSSVQRGAKEPLVREPLHEASHQHSPESARMSLEPAVYGGDVRLPVMASDTEERAVIQTEQQPPPLEMPVTRPALVEPERPPQVPEVQMSIPAANLVLDVSDTPRKQP